MESDSESEIICIRDDFEADRSYVDLQKDAKVRDAFIIFLFFYLLIC